MDYENGHPFGHFRIEGKKFGLFLITKYIKKIKVIQVLMSIVKVGLSFL